MVKFRRFLCVQLQDMQKVHKYSAFSVAAFLGATLAVVIFVRTNTCASQIVCGVCFAQASEDGSTDIANTAPCVEDTTNTTVDLAIDADVTPTVDSLPSVEAISEDTSSVIDPISGEIATDTTLPVTDDSTPLIDPISGELITSNTEESPAIDPISGEMIPDASVPVTPDITPAVDPISGEPIITDTNEDIVIQPVTDETVVPDNTVEETAPIAEEPTVETPIVEEPVVTEEIPVIAEPVEEPVLELPTEEPIDVYSEVRATLEAVIPKFDWLYTLRAEADYAGISTTREAAKTHFDLTIQVLEQHLDNATINTELCSATQNLDTLKTLLAPNIDNTQTTVDAQNLKVLDSIQTELTAVISLWSANSGAAFDCRVTTFGTPSIN